MVSLFCFPSLIYSYSTASAPAKPAAVAKPAAATQSASASKLPGSLQVDESQPTTSIQLRLGDGTRLVAKFNHTHTVGDIRRFVDAYPYSSLPLPPLLPSIFAQHVYTRHHSPITPITHYSSLSLVIYSLTVFSARRGVQAYNLMTTFPQKVIFVAWFCCVVLNTWSFVIFRDMFS